MKFLFIVLISASPVFGSLYSEIDKPEHWAFQGNFSENIDEDVHTGELQVTCTLKDHLSTISCSKDSSGSVIGIRFDTEFSKKYPGFTLEMCTADTTPPSDQLIFLELNNPSSFLKLLHEYHIVPAFVMDRILSEMNLDNFRLETHTTFQNAEKSLPDDSSFSDLIEALETFLLAIKPKEKIEKVRWELMKILLEKSPEEGESLEIFCSKITDKTLPFFDESRRALVNLQLSNIKQSDSAERAIEALLSIQNKNKDDKKLLENCVKEFMDGEKFTSQQLPEALQDLSCTPQTILMLLKHIRESR